VGTFKHVVHLWVCGYYQDMKNAKELREQWLNRVAKALIPIYSKLGYKMPAYRISCGFPSTGRKGKAIGECWAATCSKDQTHEIFIHPGQADSLEVAAILAHELAHAAVGLDKNHGPVFGSVARSIGLVGKMTATIAGDAFKATIAPILKDAGKYPHAALVAGVSSRGPKQGTRLLKACCPECGYTVRITQKWLDVAAPRCPVDGCEMPTP
jgi:hypothetical protein